MKAPSLTAIILVLSSPVFSQDVNDLKLKDYRPVSIYKITQTEIKKAKHPVIDVHTHMLSHPWFELLKAKGKPRYTVKPSKDFPAPLGIYSDGAPFMTPQLGHFDYELRIQKMNEAKVDVAIVSLTAPNCFWGGPKTSLKAAQLVNDRL